jgi:GT2 family glycosyltransferase
MKPKISVVVACRNAENTIEWCLKSILANKPDEIIVVDDASTDRSVEKIKKFPVKLVCLKKHSGIAKAEKIGIEKAAGDIIFLTNADIIVPPNWIERHLELHKEADCVGGWARYDVNFKVEEVLTLPAFNCSFKRKVLAEVGNLDENLKTGCEDVEFFLRAKARGFKLVSDSSIAVLHLHPLSYKSKVLRAWGYGLRLGKLIRRHPHGKLMSKWFLIPPIYMSFRTLKELKKFFENLLFQLTEAVGKLVGFLS